MKKFNPGNTRFIIDKIIGYPDFIESVKKLERSGTLADIMKLEYFENFNLAETNKALFTRHNSDHVLELSLYKIRY